MELLLPILAGVAFAVWRVRAHHADRTWAAIAAQHGVKHVPRVHRLDIELAGVCVRALEDQRGDTLVRARYLLGAGPRFEIHARGVTTDFERYLGMASTDLILGDREFDERFVVHGDSVDEVLRAWTGKARLLRERLPVVTVRSDGVHVELVHRGAIHEIATFDGALRLVGELAATDATSFAALAALPDAIVHPPSGGFEQRGLPRVELPGFGASIGPAVAAGKRITQVSVALPRSVARFELSLRPDGAPVGTPPAGLDWNGAAPYLREVAPAQLAGGEGLLRLWFSEWVVDPTRLLAAARLCHVLARPERR